MRIKHHWTPPEGVRNNKGAQYAFHTLGGELAFPMITDNSTETTRHEDVTRVNFSLWLINPETCTERIIEAPFCIERDHNWLSQYSFTAKTVEDGEWIFSIRQKQSYDYWYDLVSFDGTAWKQALVRERAQQVVYSELDFKAWTEPGHIELNPPLLSGGSLAVAHKPLTFAVDFTHAFSYDSGPPTPVAEEFTDIQKKAERNPPKASGFERICFASEKWARLKSCLPDDHSACRGDYPCIPGVIVPGGIVVRDNGTYGSLEGLTLVELEE
jgi:hypothetical protein